MVGENVGMRTIVVTGSSSGMGAATVARLARAGDRVIGIDVVALRADVAQTTGEIEHIVADLGTPEGRALAIAEVAARSGGAIDGIVTWAGLPALTNRAGNVIVRVNYFGTIVLLEGLRPLLAKGTLPSAVAIASNSMTCVPNVPMNVAERCLAGDEPGACEAADAATSLGSYPATKIAIARWVRRHAAGPEWAGAGIRLNAIAPGAVETALAEATRADPVLGPLSAAYAVPIGFRAEPDQLAAFAEFLLGPDARFFCGSVVYVDGGTDALARADDWPAPM
jgi:NAD(P)-dependent dehydrogenase (short-subunit alcohol dehydrogenase family)